MTIIETPEYKNLLEAREFVRNHRVSHVNNICSLAWRFLSHTENHLDNQLSDLAAEAFAAPEKQYSTAGLDPQFAEVGR